MKTISGKLRLISLFILISFIGIGAFAIWQLQKMYAHTEKMYEHPFQVNNAVRDIQIGLAETNELFGELAAGNSESISDVQKTVKGINTEISKNYNVLKERYLGDQEVLERYLKEKENLDLAYLDVLETATSGDLSSAKNSFNKSVKPVYEKIKVLLNDIKTTAQHVGEEAYIEAVTDKQETLRTLIGSIVLLTILVVLLSLWLAKQINGPIKSAMLTAQEVATGNLNAQFEINGKDEIAQLLGSIQEIVFNIKKAADFTENIGNGELNAEFEPVGDHDTLGHSLIEMRNHLKQVAEDDEKRNWSIRGLAIFADILRSNTDNVQAFGQTIITKLIEYLKINQGGIFLLTEEDGQEYMDLLASYAYDRLKYQEKRIRLGQGLVGQSWIEKERIYLTDVPNDYVHITSGLGEANPRSILIVPLRENEEIYGMVELASFQSFQEHEIEFVEKLAQSIGATFKNLQTNLKTTKLLVESQEMQAMMQEQEEELRQNAEEMQATAEQVHREAEAKRAEIEGIMKELNARIGILDKMCLVSETDKKGVITKVNKKFIEVALYQENELIGEPHNIVRHPDMPAEIWKLVWQTIGKGQPFRGIVKNKAKDGSAYWVDAVIAPKIGPDGKPDGYLGVRYDITEQIQKFETYTWEVGDQKWTVPTK